MSDPSALRRRYTRGQLDDDDVAPTWVEQLRGWFDEAVADPAVLEANAVQLATADERGRPSVRTVLVKGIDERGLVIYTNYDSAKGRDLAVNPFAAAVFVWLAHERQVRVSGRVSRVPREETAAYFAMRPRESQLGAWASPQSQVIGSRAELDDLLADVTARFGDGPIDPPPFWGGLLVAPDTVEFWQGRSGRLHDRIRFRRDPAGTVDDPTGWRRERLAP